MRRGVIIGGVTMLDGVKFEHGCFSTRRFAAVCSFVVVRGHERGPSEEGARRRPAAAVLSRKTV